MMISKIGQLKPSHIPIAFFREASQEWMLTLYSTEACIPEFSIGECMMLWEDNSFKCSSQHRSKQIQTSPLIHTSIECSSLLILTLHSPGSSSLALALISVNYFSHDSTQRCITKVHNLNSQIA